MKCSVSWTKVRGMGHFLWKPINVEKVLWVGENNIF